MTLGQRLKQIRAHIEDKLVRQGMPTDAETVQGACMAVVCLVRDPDSLSLQMTPMPGEAYEAAEAGLGRADLEFAEEITALQQLISEMERDERLLADLRHNTAAGEISLDEARHALREMMLTFFVYPEDERSEEGEPST